MIRNIVVTVLAICGLALGLFMIFWGLRTPPVQPVLFKPPESPYEYSVAGEGLIESLGDDTNLGVTFPDLVWEIFVKAGQQVKKGQPLFRTDTRQQEADLVQAQEEVNVAQVNYDNRKQEFEYYERLDDKTAVSENAYTNALYAKDEAFYQLETAKANVNRIKTIIERALVRAPMDGQVLQETLDVGEFANVNPFDRKKLMIFGSTRRVQIRVNVAEEDAWRVVPNKPATAFVRGNSSITIPLQFEYIEPLIIPKESLTGQDNERVDTRVLQIVYTFDKAGYPVYVGQLMDVYIEAKPSIPS